MTGLPSSIATGIVCGMPSSIDAADKVRENRLRRAAVRQGLQLVKSRARDPRALDFGRFMIVDAHTGGVVAGELHSALALDLDQVEAYLND
jgi:hypothetical protein